MEKIQPTGVVADRQARTLKISWADGQTSVYPYDGLRAVCPCVMCKGGHANMGGPPNPYTVRDTAATDLQLEQIQPMGSYALQLAWSDGHGSGIYTWEFLRQADPVNCEHEL